MVGHPLLLSDAQLSISLLSALLDTMPVGVIIADAGGNLLRTNSPGEQILGSRVDGDALHPQRSYTSHHLDGSPFPAREMPLVRALEQGETVSDVEILIRRADGSERIILAGAAPVHDEDGDIACAVTVFQDITDRVHEQRALRSYTDRVQLLYEMAQAILAAHSAGETAATALQHLGRLLPVVCASVTAFDLSAMRMSVLATYTGGQAGVTEGRQLPLPAQWPLDRFERGEIQIATSSSLCSAACPLSHLPGTEGVRACLQVPLLAQGALIGTLNLGLNGARELEAAQANALREVANQLAIGVRQAALHEAVQRHAAVVEQRVHERTAELRASEARIRAIFQAAGVGIAVFDDHGRLRRSNAALQDMLGYSQEALHGTAFTTFLHADHADTARALYSDLCADPEDQRGRTVEIRYAHRDGHWRWGSLTLSLVQEDSAPSHWTVAILEDITERKRAQEALINSEKLALTGRLATSLSHEINNPLQAVLGCLGLVEEMLEADQGARRYIEIAEEELERVSRIVTRLRELHDHSTKAERRETRVNTLLEQVFVLTEQQRRNARVALHATLAPDLPPLLAVSDRIRQVFLNILLNAIDAMPDGGELYVSTAPTANPQGIAISFADTGQGIDTHTLSLLFEPMCSTKPEGMGLGLYLARTIVESHGGHIDVQSQIAGGTTFHVWLPV